MIKDDLIEKLEDAQTLTPRQRIWLFHELKLARELLADRRRRVNGLNRRLEVDQDVEYYLDSDVWFNVVS